MTRSSLGVLLGSLLVLAGGSAPSWKVVGAPEGMTRQEAARILLLCRALSSGGAPTTNLGVAYVQAVNSDTNLRMCLEAHGIETADK